MTIPRRRIRILNFSREYWVRRGLSGSLSHFTAIGRRTIRLGMS